MKRLILIVLYIGWFPLLAHAAPFLVCEPQPGQEVEWYVVTGLPAQIDGSHVPPDATGTYGFRLDMAATPSGVTYTVKAKACTLNPLWGEVCSVDSPPFEFERPLAPSSPNTPRLAQQ